MMRFLFFLFLILTAPLSFPAENHLSKKPPTHIKFVFEGDSLSDAQMPQGKSNPAMWTIQIAEISQFFRHGEKINVAHGGDTASNILINRYHKDVHPEKPT